MPYYRTKYGKHYHETKYCCGANIPVSSSTGLTPCSRCCQGARAKRDEGDAGGTAVMSAGAPEEPLVGTYVAPEEEIPAEAPEEASAKGKATFHLEGWVEIEDGYDLAIESVYEVADDAAEEAADDIIAFPPEVDAPDLDDEQARQLAEMTRWWMETHAAEPTLDPMMEEVCAREATASVARRVSESQDMPVPLATAENPADTAHDLLESSPLRKELLDKARALANLGTRMGVPGAGLLLPVIDVVGKIPVSAMRGIRVMASDIRSRMAYSRAVRRVMRQEGCDRYTAECLHAWNREKELRAAQSAAASVIKEDLIYKSLTTPGLSADDIIFEDIQSIGTRLRSGQWIVDEEKYNSHQTLALARVLQRRLEQEGYGDKVTPAILQRMREEEGLQVGEESAVTLALRGVMAEHDFRVGTAKRAARRWARMRAVREKQAAAIASAGTDPAA